MPRSSTKCSYSPLVVCTFLTPPETRRDLVVEERFNTLVLSRNVSITGE